MIASYPDRRFQLWEYHVSHGMLLIRSPKGPEINHHVDLIFAGVEYVSITRLLRGVVIEMATELDLELLESSAGNFDPNRVFLLHSGRHKNVVVAAAFEARENRDDIFSSPFRAIWSPQARPSGQVQS